MKMENDKNTQLFMGLCSSLVTQAWMQLGKIKNPMTDKIEINLEAASLTIDMLSMLKDKTNGNTGDEEVKILEQSINELRMNYIMSKDNKEKTSTEDDKKKKNKEKASRKTKPTKNEGKDK